METAYIVIIVTFAVTAGGICHGEGLTPDVLAIINDLQEQVQENRELITKQNALILDLQETSKQQHVKQEFQGSQIKALEALVDDLSQHLKTAIDTAGTNASVTIGSSSRVHNKRLVLGESPVAFHAAISQFADVTHLGINQKIVFPEVLINLGGGYHAPHGIFTAPFPGVYIFSTSVMSSKVAPSEIAVHLVKNDKIIANAYAKGTNGHQDQGSITITTQLAAADEVWVTLYDPFDSAVWGNYFTSFMGCLVQGI